jgi:hypothetical protein
MHRHVREYVFALLIVGIGGSICAQPVDLHGPPRTGGQSDVLWTEGAPAIFCDTLIVFTPLEPIDRSEWSGVERLEMNNVIGFERVGTVGLLIGGALGGFAAWTEHGGEGACGIVEPSCPIAGQAGHGSATDGNGGNRAATALLLGSVSAAMGALVGVVSPDRGDQAVRLEPYLTVGPAGGWFAGARVCFPLSESRSAFAALTGRSR